MNRTPTIAFNVWMRRLVWISHLWVQISISSSLTPIRHGVWDSSKANLCYSVCVLSYPLNLSEALLHQSSKNIWGFVKAYKHY